MFPKAEKNKMFKFLESSQISLSDFKLTNEHDKLLIIHIPSSYYFLVEIEEPDESAFLRKKETLVFTQSPDFYSPIIRTDKTVTLGGYDDWAGIHVSFNN